MQNVDHKSCELCGSAVYALSSISIIGGYGSSSHDGDKITLSVCGSCIDQLFDAVEAIGTEAKQDALSSPLDSVRRALGVNRTQADAIMELVEAFR